MRSSMTASYHIIEKGLSMPNRRLGFGRDKLLSLINECLRYYDHYGMHGQLSYAISIIREYDLLHKQQNFKLDNELQTRIDSFLTLFPDIAPASQMAFTKKEYFKYREAAFNVFSESRHSMRHFMGSIPIETIERAVDLARNAPSACNKQPTRVYIVTGQNDVSDILKMQQGNRGFGQNIDKIIIVTTQFSGCTRFSERYMPFMDAGIFTMNLLYSLHFYEIGAIPLVWLSSKMRDKELRKKANIPIQEIPAILIGIGNVSNNIICAKSPRLDLETLLCVK